MRVRFSLRIKEEMLARFDGNCGICGQPLCGRIDWDHIIPLALGGPDTPENLQPVHAEGCHSEKTKRDVKRIAKCKRQAGLTGQYARRTARKAKGQKALIQNAGFSKTMTRGFDGVVRHRNERMK